MTDLSKIKSTTFPYLEVVVVRAMQQRFRSDFRREVVVYLMLCMSMYSLQQLIYLSSRRPAAAEATQLFVTEKRLRETANFFSLSSVFFSHNFRSMDGDDTSPDEQLVYTYQTGERFREFTCPAFNGQSQSVARQWRRWLLLVWGSKATLIPLPLREELASLCFTTHRHLGHFHIYSKPTESSLLIHRRT